MTPSRKLNRMLYGSNSAGLASKPMADPDREPDNRVPTAETQAVIDKTLAMLRAASGGRQRI